MRKNEKKEMLAKEIIKAVPTIEEIDHKLNHYLDKVGELNQMKVKIQNGYLIEVTKLNRKLSESKSLVQALIYAKYLIENGDNENE